MKQSVDDTLTKQFILPLDESRDLRLQAYHYQKMFFYTLKSLRKLVRDAHLDSEEEHDLLYGLAYIEAHFEQQTQDMCANILTRSN